ncbi:MAG: carboxypeptidase-like regulatory domain-containing protein [Planctomycetota bacterium]
MPFNIPNRCSMIALLIGLSMFLGCGGQPAGPKTAKVTGVVTYKAQPVIGATVTFTAPKAPRTGVGVTNDKGAFTIGTFGADDGAVLGDHVVTVAKRPASTEQMKPEDYMKKMSGGPGDAAKPAIPGSDIKNELPTKYSTTKESPLKAKVEAGAKNEFQFDLTD